MTLKRNGWLLTGALVGFCGGFAAAIASRLGALLRAEDQEIGTDDLTFLRIPDEDTRDESFNPGPA